jgi:hypothetical protein
MMGGIPEGHRPLLVDGGYGAFEQAVDRALGDRVRASQEDAVALWSALANVDWYGPNGIEVSYSFRAAGDLVATLRRDEGRMTYMNYYCQGPAGEVATWIEEALATEGWAYYQEPD